MLLTTLCTVPESDARSLRPVPNDQEAYKRLAMPTVLNDRSRAVGDVVLFNGHRGILALHHKISLSSSILIGDDIITGVTDKPLAGIKLSRQLVRQILRLYTCDRA